MPVWDEIEDLIAATCRDTFQHPTLATLSYLDKADRSTVLATDPDLAIIFDAEHQIEGYDQLGNLVATEVVMAAVRNQDLSREVTAELDILTIDSVNYRIMEEYTDGGQMRELILQELP